MARCPISRLFVTLVLGSLFSTASCSRGLDREKASALIRADERFKAPVFVAFRTSTSGNFITDKVTYSDLVDLGLVDLKELPNMGTVISLTEKGRAASKTWEHRVISYVPYQGQDTWRFGIASRSFLECTGLAEQAGGAEVVVKFRWQWTESSPIARKMKDLILDKAWESEALLKRYDDGWRVETLEGFGPATLGDNQTFNAWN